MWQQIFDFAKQLFTLTRDLQETKEDIKALREENKELRREMNEQRLQYVEMTRFAERIVYELQRTQASADADKRLLRLEMENLLLRHGHSQPKAISDQEGHEPNNGNESANNARTNNFNTSIGLSTQFSPKTSG